MSDIVAPNHIGYILDGNRRWAKKHGLPVYEGHLAGYEALKEVIDATADAGVKYISMYTWSTENWNRAEEEVMSMMKLVRAIYGGEMKELLKKGYKLVFLGSRDGVPDDISKMMDDLESNSSNGTRATLATCFNYGGQQEIVRAARQIVQKGMKPEDIDEKIISENLDHPEVPPCDLIVRTSGEQRLSNFMLWRSAYSEFMFLDKYWPDMRATDVSAILEEYNKRTRRFGG